MCIVWTCYEPTLSLRMHDYGLTQSQIGVVLGIQPVLYMICCILVPFVIPKWIEDRVTLITGLFCLGVLTTLVGPFYTDKDFTVFLIGLISSGIFFAPLIIPNMSEMLKGMRLAYPDADLERGTSLLSGMMTASIGVGQASGPLIGSAIYQVAGFRVMCDVIASVVILYAFIYLFGAQGCQAYKQTCVNFRNRNND